MAQPRDTTFSTSSPHSSCGGADSYKHEGTPDTRLTAFSPDENSVRSTKPSFRGLPLSASDPHSLRLPVKHGNAYAGSSITAEKDPFVTTNIAAAKREQKLSPTASAFRPYSIPVVAHGSAERVSSLAPSSTLSVPGFFNSTLSRDLGLSRYLVVASSLGAVAVSTVEAYIQDLEQHGTVCRGKYQLYSHADKVYIRFTNIRDAQIIGGIVPSGSPGWYAEYVRAEHYQLINPSFRADIAHEGLVSLDAVVGSNLSGHIQPLDVTIYRLLRNEADIFAFVPQEINVVTSSLYILIEFSDVEDTIAIINKFKDFTADGIKLSLSVSRQNTAFTQNGSPEYLLNSYRSTSLPDMTSLLQSFSLGRTSQTSGSLFQAGRPSPGAADFNMTPRMALIPYNLICHGQLAGGTPYMMDRSPTRSPSISSLATSLSPLGSVYHPANHAFVPQHGDFAGSRSMQPFHRSDMRRQNATRVNRAPYYNAAGHHNHVDVHRIRDGIDVRTTIMLRNIPNKVDQQMLKHIIDESSWGKYDFMYLRIDFANDCNVGYAFINFVDPLDIIDFVNARGNQRWNCFKSDKVAEISYATIQGKDCLVQKFRNSSVMLEAPHYRPKLYYTCNGPNPDLAGEEEPFPEPDNQSKMKRSCENAEHVGLFTPNAGQHFRDEQRRRRSQYDRGTRLAALEEYDIETAILYPGLTGH